jgi:hypothetical protein
MQAIRSSETSVLQEPHDLALQKTAFYMPCLCSARPFTKSLRVISYLCPRSFFLPLVTSDPVISRDRDALAEGLGSGLCARVYEHLHPRTNTDVAPGRNSKYRRASQCGREPKWGLDAETAWSRPSGLKMKGAGCALNVATYSHYGSCSLCSTASVV